MFLIQKCEEIQEARCRLFVAIEHGTITFEVCSIVALTLFYYS